MSLIAIQGTRGQDMRAVFDRAMECMDECDGVVIFMERKEGGLLWFAPDSMTIKTLVFYCWTALHMFGNMAAGIKL